MIHLTDTSFISALLFFTVALILITCLRRFTKMLERTGAASLVLTFILAAVRLFLPIYLPFSKVISIPAVWPGVSLFFREHPYIWPIMLAVWILGAVGIIARDVYHIRLNHRVYRSFPAEDDPQAARIAAGLGITCPVVTSYDIDIPCVVGILRHTIYLPVQDVSDSELELMLKHEYWHVLAFHNELKVLYGLISALLWWTIIPLFFRQELDDLFELHCDQGVIGPMDTLERIRYTDMLQEAAREMVGTTSHGTSTDETPLLFLHRPSITAQRLMILRNMLGRSVPKVTVKTVCFMAAIFVASYLVIFEPGGAPPPQDFEVDSGIIYDNYSDRYDPNPEEDGTFLFKRADGRYELCINYEFSKYLSQDEVDSEKYKGIPVYYEEGVNP